MPLISVVLPYVREKGAQRCVEALKQDTTFTDYEILMEYDSERIGCPKMVKRLVEKSSGKYVCFLADDTIPRDGLLKEAMIVMNTFSDSVGLVGFNSHDFHCGDNRASHWLGSKKLLPVLGGEFFHIGYTHSFCDDELVERCTVMNRYKYASKAKLQHLHPKILLGLASDDDYERVDSAQVSGRDCCLFVTRRNMSNVWKNKI